VRADEKLTAFMEHGAAVRKVAGTAESAEYDGGYGKSAGFECSRSRKIALTLSIGDRQNHTRAKFVRPLLELHLTLFPQG